MKPIVVSPLAGASLMLLALFNFAAGQSTIVRVPSLGGPATEVRALNHAGDAAGLSRTATGQQHAFLFSRGVMTDIPTLGGPTALGNALNEFGDVVGESTLAGMPAHAFLYSGGVVTDLGTLGGFYSTAVAVNGARDVAGDSETSDGGIRSFQHRYGQMTDLGSLGSGYSFTAAMNANGDVTGDSYNEFFEPRAFLYRNGSMTDLGTLGGGMSMANALNDTGEVVGDSLDENGAQFGFVYRNGAMQKLSLGGSESSAFAINNAGQVLADGWTAGDTAYHAFLVSNGVVTDLGTLGGDYSEGAAINNWGHVVGRSENALGVLVPFLWKDGVMVDLNSLLPTNSGWRLFTARFINDAGQIAGLGTLNGTSAWYILTPSSGNQPPVANAGSDLTVECGTATRLDGTASSDPDGDTLTFAWSEGGVSLGSGAALSVNLGLGTHTVTLTVTDPSGATAEDSVVVVVRDTTAPRVVCPAERSVVAGPDCGAVVPDFTASVVAMDDCTSSTGLLKAQSPVAGSLVGLGTHLVTVTATDTSGNVGSCTVTFTVVDATAPVGHCPEPVRVVAGDDCLGVLPDLLPQVAATDNCTPATALTKSQSPLPGTSLPLGSHTVTFTVKDAAGNESRCDTLVRVVDATPPTVVCPEPVVLEVKTECRAQVPDLRTRAAAADNCGDVDVKQTPAPGTLLGVGVHLITLTVTDLSGNTGACTTTLTVVDRTAPEIASISVSPEVIENVTRDMVPVVVSVTANDNCDPAPVSRIVSITSNEPETGPGDNTAPDTAITGSLTGLVRAERSPRGEGRLYTITVLCVDASGNKATASVSVFVPRKRGNDQPADNAGGSAKRK
ncbi:MAG: HYR domain-containing protein [Verrucomicrobia subdivision 3 bacterium]|nr:HYR domain-containing protein [Limisphaerales bacterium]